MYYTLTNKAVTFVLEGAEQVAALKAKVHIDIKDIVDVSWHEIFSEWNTLSVRMPGSYIPRWIMAGSYWSDDGWDFIYAKKPTGMLKPILYKVLVITTSKDRYKRIILETTEQNSKEIINWWKEK